RPRRGLGGSHFPHPRRRLGRGGRTARGAFARYVQPRPRADRGQAPQTPAPGHGDLTGRGDGILLANDAARPPAGKREGNHMKKDVGLALYGLLGLLLAPAATWLGERAAYLAAQGLTSGLWLASSAHLLIYI